MPNDAREPQSYGSQADWTTGKTGESVNAPTGDQEAKHPFFYDSRRDSEGNAEMQGGSVSPVQLADSTPRSTGVVSDEATPTQKVAIEHAGAKREGFFKDRDWK